MDDPTEELIRLKREQIAGFKKLILLKESELEDLLLEQSSEQKRDKTKLEPLTKLDTLSNDAIGRYSRQMILPELRPEGQRKLGSSSVLVVGCGGNHCM